MNIAHDLKRSAQRCGPMAAIGHGTEVWCNYREFAAMAARGATWLSATGGAARRPRRAFPAQPAGVPALAVVGLVAGAVAVPINAKLHVKEVAWIAAHSGSRCVFSGDDDREALQRALRDEGHDAQVETSFAHLFDTALDEAPVAERAEHDAAWLFYTSGTTGRPKGVELAARQLRWQSMGLYTAVQAVEPARRRCTRRRCRTEAGCSTCRM